MRSQGSTNGGRPLQSPVILAAARVGAPSWRRRARACTRALRYDVHLLLTVSLAALALVVELAEGDMGESVTVLAAAVALVALQVLARGAARCRLLAGRPAAIDTLRFALTLAFVTVIVQTAGNGGDLRLAPLYIPVVAMAAGIGSGGVVVIAPLALLGLLAPEALRSSGRLDEAVLRAIALSGVTLIVAIGYWRAAAADRRRARQMRSLEAVSRQLAEAGPTPDVLSAVMAVLADRFGYRYVSLHVIQDDGIARLAAQRGYATTLDIDATRGVVGRAIRTQQPAFVPDVRADPDYVSADPAVGSEICVPLLARGALLGILNVESVVARPLGDADRGVLVTVGDRLAAALALALERARLAERAATFGHLVEFSARVSGVLAETELYEAIIDAAWLVVPSDLVGLTVVDRTLGTYLVRATRGAEGVVGQEIKPGEGMAGCAIRDRVLVRADDYDRAVFPAAVRAGTAVDRFGSAVGVPLVRDGAVIGALTLGRVDGARPFTRLELEALELLSNEAAMALGAATLHAELAERALHDALTGLPTRALFMARLEHALRRANRARDGGVTGVLFLDLDDFKQVNDTFGHRHGDAVLVAVSRRLEAGLRAGDTVARFSGDEFIILLEGLESPASAEAAAVRLLELLAPALEVEGQEIIVSASVGMATAVPGEASADELVGHADLAMYAAKAAGRGQVEGFERQMSVVSQRRLELVPELRRAIEDRTLLVHYQPIFDLATRRMTGVEALARWPRPGHGFVPPSEFIPLAEASGLIGRLGQLVLQTACRQVRDWQGRWPAAAGLELSVNVSTREFRQGLVASVRQVLKSAGLDPRTLKLEITESAMFEEAGVAEAAMAELRGLGVRFVVDDFGTGYSALGYFKRFGISGLKLDRSFVQGLGHGAADTAIVTAALAFARTLGLSVTAEGIEDLDQLDWLRAAGCELGQGYLLARPLPAEAFEGLLAEVALPAPAEPNRTEPSAGE